MSRGRNQFCPFGLFGAAVALLVFASSASHLSAARVIDESAIPYLAFLSRADFDARFPGDSFDDLSKLEAGWYVIYEHESLSYYFGPILLQSTGLDYLKQLEKIVGEAVAQRPSIEGYRLELSFEPSESGSAQESQPSRRGDPEAPSTNSPTQPPSSSGLWGFFKRLFGF